MRDAIALVCFVAGTLLIMLAAIGAVRFPDAAARLHAAAKAPVLGLLVTGVGVVVALPRWDAIVVVALVIVLQMIASPVGSHILARSIYYRVRPELDGPDELADALDREADQPD